MSLSCFPPAFSLFFCFSFLFFFLYFCRAGFLMPKTTAQPELEMAPAGVTPAQGNELSPALSVAQARGKEDPSLLHNCQRRLPPPSPCLRKLLDGIERVAKSGDRFSPSPSSHPEQASVARGKDSTCPQGAHTHTHTPSAHTCFCLALCPSSR